MTAINLTLLPLIYATAVRFTLIAVSRNRQLRTLCTRLALLRSEQGAHHYDQRLFFANCIHFPLQQFSNYFVAFSL